MSYLPESSAGFQSNALAAEQDGQWPADWLNLAKDPKLFHQVVPKKYGGLQLLLQQLLRIFEQASLFDGSFGWTLTFGTGVFAAFIDPKFAREQFAKPHTFITCSSSPSGTAR